jgi:hypothetical protein
MKVIETKLPAGEIIGLERLADGTWVVKQKVAEVRKPRDLDKKFILIDAESLSLNDEFMQHEPKTEREKKFKALLTEVIAKGIKNFYRPKYDPSFIDDDEGIRFADRKKPAVGKSCNWWEKAAKEFNPERKSRLGTRLEYVAFLGVLIKALVAEGKTIDWAWNAVCNDSKELGHYRDSENAKHRFESTGSRCIADFSDLANTYKILAEDEEAGGFWLAGGCYNDVSYLSPLAGLDHLTNRDLVGNLSVGWLVLS